jgi:hypothetical protein
VTSVRARRTPTSTSSARAVAEVTVFIADLFETDLFETDLFDTFGLPRTL